MTKQELTTFGETIKQLRLNSKLPQRKVAAYLDIDTSLLAKYERNVRQPSKELIKKMAELFGVDGEHLFAEAITDKIAIQIAEDDVDSKLLRVAESKAEYFKTKNKTI